MENIITGFYQSCCEGQIAEDPCIRMCVWLSHCLCSLVRARLPMSSPPVPLKEEHSVAVAVQPVWLRLWLGSHQSQQLPLCWCSVRLQPDLKSDLHLLLCISASICVTAHGWSKFTTAVWKHECGSSGRPGYLNHFLSWFQSSKQDLHLLALSTELSKWIFSLVTVFGSSA